MNKVTFVFSHAVLVRAWQKAKALLVDERIELWITSQTAPIDWTFFAEEQLAHADAAYLDVARHFPTFEPLVAAARKVPLAVLGGMETTSVLPGPEPHAAEIIAAYLKAGSRYDLANAARYLLYLAGKRSERPALPSPPVLCGIYARECERPFSSVAEYLDWRQSTSPGTSMMPLAAYCFERTAWLDGETTLLDAIVREAEAQGLLVLPVFCDWELATRITEFGHPMSQILADCGERLAAIWNGLFSHVIRGRRGQSFFAQYDVPVFQVVRTYNQSPEQWLAGDEGLSPMTLSYSIIQPEMLGSIEPTVLAGNRQETILGNPEPANKAVPIPERIQHLARRSLAWHRLRKLPNAEKRVATVLHNAPCKGVEGTLATAAGLDALESTVRLLQRLADEGYRVENVPNDGAGLLRLMLDRKAIQEFRSHLHIIGWQRTGSSSAKPMR